MNLLATLGRATIGRGAGGIASVRSKVRKGRERTSVFELTRQWYFLFPPMHVHHYQTLRLLSSEVVMKFLFLSTKGDGVYCPKMVVIL